MLPWAICGFILIAPIARVSLSLSGFSTYAQYNTPVFSNFDTLGFGALLGWGYSLATTRQTKLLTRCLRIATPFAMLLFIVSIILENDLLRIALRQTMLAVLVVSVIEATNDKAGQSALRVLSLPVCVYIGQISYGIYLYHPFCRRVVEKLIDFSGASGTLGVGFWGFVFATLMTLVVASFSWFWIERPLNSLKTYFPYAGPFVAVDRQI